MDWRKFFTLMLGLLRSRWSWNYISLQQSHLAVNTNQLCSEKICLQILLSKLTANYFPILWLACEGCLYQWIAPPHCHVYSYLFCTHCTYKFLGTGQELQLWCQLCFLNCHNIWLVSTLKSQKFQYFVSYTIDIHTAKFQSLNKTGLSCVRGWGFPWQMFKFVLIFQFNNLTEKKS